MSIDIVNTCSARLWYLQLISEYNLPSSIVQAVSLEDVVSLVNRKESKMFLSSCRFSTSEIQILTESTVIYDTLLSLFMRETVDVYTVKFIASLWEKIPLEKREEDNIVLQIRMLAQLVNKIGNRYRVNKLMPVVLWAVTNNVLTQESSNMLRNNLETSLLDSVDEEYLPILFEVDFTKFLKKYYNNAHEWLPIVAQSGELRQMMKEISPYLGEPKKHLSLRDLKLLREAISKEDLDALSLAKERMGDSFKDFVNAWATVYFPSGMLQKAVSVEMSEVPSDGAYAVIAKLYEGDYPCASGLLCEQCSCSELIAYAMTNGKENFLAMFCENKDDAAEKLCGTFALEENFYRYLVDLNELNSIGLVERISKVGNIDISMFVNSQLHFTIEEVLWVLETNLSYKMINLYIRLKENLDTEAQGRMEELIDFEIEPSGSAEDYLVKAIVEKSFAQIVQEMRERIQDVPDRTVLNMITAGVMENEALLSEFKTVDEVNLVLHCLQDSDVDAKAFLLKYIQTDFAKYHSSYKAVLRKWKIASDTLDDLEHLLYDFCLKKDGSRFFDVLLRVSDTVDASQIIAVLKAVALGEFARIKNSAEMLNRELMQNVPTDISDKWFTDTTLAVGDKVFNLSGGEDGIVQIYRAKMRYYRDMAQGLCNAGFKVLWDDENVFTVYLTTRRSGRTLAFEDLSKPSTADVKFVICVTSLTCSYVPKDICVALAEYFNMPVLANTAQIDKNVYSDILMPLTRLGNGVSGVDIFNSYSNAFGYKIFSLEETVLPSGE